MNTRLIKLLNDKKKEVKYGVMLDCYNQSIYNDIACSITTRINDCNHYFIVDEMKKEKINVKQVGNIVNDSEIGFKNPQRGRVYSVDGLSPCLNCCEGGGLEPKIIQKFGDRGTNQYSVRDIAHTIPSNPMSDRGQMLIEPTEEYKYIDYEQITENNTRKVLCVLQQKIGEETYKWAIGRFVGIFKEEILRQRVYEESICEGRKYETRLQSCTSLIKEDNVYTSRQRKGLRDMRSNQKYRCASQGFQLSEQFTKEFNDIVSQLSHEDAQTKECLSYLWKTCQGVQSMQQTLSAFKEVWRPLSSALEYIQTHKYRIRKITCREAFRLMGVDDDDIDTIQASGISNSSQYKLAGNSIVVDVLYHIFRKAFVEKENESQQLTFF